MTLMFIGFFRFFMGFIFIESYGFFFFSLLRLFCVWIFLVLVMLFFVLKFDFYGLLLENLSLFFLCDGIIYVFVI